MFSRCVNCVRFVPSLQLNSELIRSFNKSHYNYRKDIPIISCKRSEFNHFFGQNYKKYEEVQLASKGWLSKKSKGDYFLIHGDANRSESRTQLYKSDVENFTSLGVDIEIQNAVNDLGIMRPTEIQVSAIRKILAGHNTLISAETGCGKTLAYLIPILQQLRRWKPLMPKNRFNSPIILIISPIRELAEQIREVVDSFYPKFGLKSSIILGRGTKHVIMNPTYTECDILVATLGALSKLVTTGVYKMNNVRHVVLDEADTLLDDSFNEKLSYFLKRIPFHYQNLKEDVPTTSQLTMASATMPKELPQILSSFIHPDSLRQVTTEGLHKIMPHVPQKFLRISKSQKPLELLKLVKADMAKRIPVMIFSNKSTTCSFVSIFLNQNGLPAIHLTGHMDKDLKINRYNSFKRGMHNILSCTDVAARGLDTTMARHIINYDFPMYSADYIHRCGRTGRLGTVGECLVTNFVSSAQDVEMVQKLELAARHASTLPQVDNNITKILKRRYEREIYQYEREQMKKASQENVKEEAAFN